MLRDMPGPLVETDAEVGPKAALSGVYRYVGAVGKSSEMNPGRFPVPRAIFPL